MTLLITEMPFILNNDVAGLLLAYGIILLSLLAIYARENNRRILFVFTILFISILMIGIIVVSFGPSFQFIYFTLPQTAIGIGSARREDLAQQPSGKLHISRSPTKQRNLPKLDNRHSEESSLSSLISFSAPTQAGWLSLDKSVGLMIQKSQVQILPPLPSNERERSEGEPLTKSLAFDFGSLSFDTNTNKAPKSRFVSHRITNSPPNHATVIFGAPFHVPLRKILSPCPESVPRSYETGHSDDLNQKLSVRSGRQGRHYDAQKKGFGPNQGLGSEHFQRRIQGISTPSPPYAQEVIV